MKSNNLIEIKDLNLKMKKDVILSGINKNFERGKIHGLIGRNGSGKTMLLKCICGFVRPTSGSVLFDGKTIGKDVDFPSNTGIIIETPGFIPYYSGYRNLKILADLNRKVGKEEILRTLELVGLKDAQKKQVRTYSLGMRQRLGLAQAIMEKPDTLILDEPMNGLDKEGVKEVRELLLGLKEQGKTILLVSHNREDIDVLCDTICELEHGRIV